MVDNHILRNVNNNDFFVEVQDRKKPTEYKFVIFTEARGGSTYFTE